MKYAAINPNIEPMKIPLILGKLKLFVRISLNQEKKEINATARITPGIAYPEIENILKLSKILLFDILFPKLIKKAKQIKILLAKNTNKSVFRFNSNMFVS